jgi:hypothetical protein
MKPTLHEQEVANELGLGELELAGHAIHVVATVAPTVVEYVPAPQSVHAALPVAVLYLPATHGEQTPPSGPVKPTLQVQAVRATLELGELELVGHPIQVVATVAPAVVEYVPAPQSVHAALPVAVLYLPAAQAAHGPDPSGPEKPTLHVQAARAELEIGELELVGHATQVAAAVAPVVAKYVPAEQSVQTALPVVVLYLPAAHAVHGIGVLVNNAVISACVNTLLYIRISPICPANPRPVSPLFATVKSLNLGNVCPVVPVPVARCVPSTYNIVDTGFASDNV